MVNVRIFAHHPVKGLKNCAENTPEVGELDR